MSVKKHTPEIVCNKLHDLVDELYEAFYTDKGRLSKGITEPCEALGEIIYYANKQIQQLTEERDTSKSCRS